MKCLATSLFLCALLAIFGVSQQSSAFAQRTATIERIAVHSEKSALAIEIDTSNKPTSPAQGLVLSNPDRIVLDFPNAVPAPNLRTTSVNNARLLRIRVAQFTANPPVTRVVLDLQSPQPYRLTALRNAIRIELGTSGAGASPVPTSAAPTSPTSKSEIDNAQNAPAPATPPLQVSLANGMLRIHADRTTLAEVLTEIQHQTGSVIDFPPDAAQDRVVVDLGPGLPRKVLSALLDGSRYNYVVLGSEHDPDGLHNVLLTLRTGGESQPAVQAQPYAPPAQQRIAEPPDTPMPELPLPADSQPEPEQAPPDAPPQQ